VAWRIVIGYARRTSGDQTKTPAGAGVLPVLSIFECHAPKCNICFKCSN